MHAVAGIGNPQRFFDMLKKQGLEVIPHAFADHHDFQPGDLQLNPSCPILMTEKDAVKCRRFAQADQWVVPVRAELDERFREQLSRLLEPLLAEYKARRDL